MKSILILMLCISGLMVFPSSKINAAELPKENRTGTISATGNASDSFTPDTAEIVLAVESKALSASEAANRNKKVADRVIKKLKKYISNEKKEMLKTSSYSLQPVYEYKKGMQKNVLTGYRAIHQITVKTIQINNSGPIIDSALEEGANRVDSIQFSITEDREYCDGLLAKAALRAKEDAKAVSGALAVKIAGIKSASISCGSEHARPIARYGMMRETMASKVATPIEAGSIKLTASVSTVFFIE